LNLRVGPLSPRFVLRRAASNPMALPRWAISLLVHTHPSACFHPVAGAGAVCKKLQF
jgi:hypothetical protein